MAKQTGLGDNLYVAEFDLSGDVGSLGAIGGGNSPLEVTGIDKSAFERLGGLRDGRIEFTSFFNDATGQEHPALKTLPTTDRIISYLRGTALGGEAASLVGKQINYDGSRGADGSFTFEVAAQANGFGLEWGRQLTSGRDTIASAAAGTGVDYGAAVGTTAFGLQAYLHVFSLGSGTPTVAIQMSQDDAAGDPYANVTGGVFTAITGVTSERIQTSRTESIERWLRINVTGTFTNLNLAVIVVKNLTSVVF